MPLTATKRTNMQTLNAKLSVIPHPAYDGTIFRIVNEERIMVAKVNGPDNVPICEQMTSAYNRLNSLKNYCVNLIRVRVEGKTEDELSLWGNAIKKVLDEGGDVERLIFELGSQACDQPETMKIIIGEEATAITMFFFNYLSK